MNMDDFDFCLPEDLIATRPARPRSSARLLVAGKTRIEDRIVTDLPDYLRPGDRLVLNDTKVIPARLSGVRRRMTGQGEVSAKIEATLLEPIGGTVWRSLIKPLRKIKPGEIIEFGDTLCAEVVRIADGTADLSLQAQGDIDAAIDRAGMMPLPPYIAAKRPADDQDRDDYQTVWARETGAVAAPTASLHFDDALLSALAAKGVDISYVTLHVGAGTFLPVKVDDPRDHKMHSERGEITEQAAHEMNETRAAGGRIIPVGTTALRLLETGASGGTLAQWTGSTDIFIYPGHKFRAVDALMTNFHLPKSTLMMLVSALMGTDRIKQVYAHALAEKYRFFSYGDASLLLPDWE